MSQFQLMKKVVCLFPRTAYTSDSAVRHARRQWLQSVAILRGRPESAWVIDRKVERRG